ncbi:MAG: helix-turn-helix domain-containing protein [Bacilli bacterium]
MLKEYRIKEGFAQEEMAELLNISWHHYQRIEIVKGTPSLETFIDIIEILKITNDEAIILLKKFQKSISNLTIISINQKILVPN